MSPVALVVGWVIAPRATALQGRVIEADVHRTLQPRRLHGEWFEGIVTEEEAWNAIAPDLLKPEDYELIEQSGIILHDTNTFTTIEVVRMRKALRDIGWDRYNGGELERGGISAQIARWGLGYGNWPIEAALDIDPDDPEGGFVPMTRSFD